MILRYSVEARSPRASRGPQRGICGRERGRRFSARRRRRFAARGPAHAAAIDRNSGNAPALAACPARASRPGAGPLPLVRRGKPKPACAGDWYWLIGASPLHRPLSSQISPWPRPPPTMPAAAHPRTYARGVDQMVKMKASRKKCMAALPKMVTGRCQSTKENALEKRRPLPR